MLYFEINWNELKVSYNVISLIFILIYFLEWEKAK